MLFNGEAIFGVIHFADATHIAAERADWIVEQAKQLGAHAEFRSSGPAHLGFAATHGSAVDDACLALTGNVCGVVCGELFDRQESSLRCYNEEPDRSSFVAKGIRNEGTTFIDHLDGTFAAAIWGERERQLILACDRRADCRLYYSLEDDQIVFSSWLALLNHASLEVDSRAVAEFLRFLYIAPPRTIYRGVASVEPGHYVVARPGMIEARPVVSPMQFRWEAEERDQDADALRDFQFLMEQAVARRLGQRRTAVFLSSGVDSATVMAACHRLNRGRVEAYTIGFDQADLDETNAARSLAEQLGVPYHELRFELDQYEAAFQQMTIGFEQPFGDPAALPLVLASQQLSGTTEVITGGTGGDDLFGAPIPRHLWFSTAIAGRFPRSLRQALAKAAGALGRGDVFDFDDLPELFVTWKGWTGRELGELLGTAPDFSDSGFYRKFREHRHCDPQSLYDALGIYPPDDCRFESAALARLPIELPYHDFDLTAYVQQLPQDLRMSHGDTKILLRRLFAHYFPAGRLPEKKHYFNIPLHTLMARSNFALVNEWLAPDLLKKQGFVDPQQARSWIARYLAGESALGFRIWALVVLHAWLEAR